jgi:hypothetical protein
MPSPTRTPTTPGATRPSCSGTDRPGPQRLGAIQARRANGQRARPRAGQAPTPLPATPSGSSGTPTPTCTPSAPRCASTPTGSSCWRPSPNTCRSSASARTSSATTASILSSRTRSRQAVPDQEPKEDLPTTVRKSSKRGTMTSMHVARVKNGRLTLDEPTDLPDGTKVPLEIADDWDDLSD